MTLLKMGQIGPDHKLIQEVIIEGKALKLLLYLRGMPLYEDDLKY